MDREQILFYLKSNDPKILDDLIKKADEIRRQYVKDQVHLRGLVEFSNYCRRRCCYCGINSNNKDIPRYKMSIEEILSACENVVKARFGTVVFQSGEGAYNSNEIAELVYKIKQSFDIAVTLSVGEYKREDYILWKDAGANRYLLRFETGIKELYSHIHPDSPLERRIEILKLLKELKYETGTGIMVGVPGQTFESIADDLIKMKELDIDMIGLGPYIPHPGTILGKEYFIRKNCEVPNTIEMTLKVLALTRILMPDTNIPSTTAIATINDIGRTSALNAGANVFMPNMTPYKYRRLYQIYPEKNAEFAYESPEDMIKKISSYLKTINREPGAGYGNRISVKS